MVSFAPKTSTFAAVAALALLGANAGNFANAAAMTPRQATQTPTGAGMAVITTHAM